MIRQLSPHPTGVQKIVPRTFDNVTGPSKELRLPGNREAIVWAFAGTDGILRTLAATFPAGQPGPLNDVASYLAFLP